MSTELLNRKRFYEAHEYDQAIQQRDAAFEQLEAMRADNARLQSEKERVLQELKDIRAEQSQQVQQQIKENMRNLDAQGMQKVIDLNNESLRQQREDQERAALSEFDHLQVARLQDENQRLKAENELLRAENAELKSLVIELSKKVDIQNTKIELQQTQIELQQTQISQQQAQFEKQQTQIDSIVSRLDNAERIDKPMQQSTERYQQAQASAEASVKPVWLGSSMSMHVTREGNVFVQGQNGDFNYDSGYTANLKANPDLYKASVLRAGGNFNQQGKVIQYDRDGNAINGPAQNNQQWLQAYNQYDQKMADAETAYEQGMTDMEVDGLSQDEIDDRVAALNEDRSLLETQARQEFDAFNDQEQGLNSISSGEVDAKLMLENRLSQEAEQQAPEASQQQDEQQQAPEAEQQQGEQFAVEDNAEYPIEDTPTNDRRLSQVGAEIDAQQAEPPGVAQAAEIHRRR